MEHFKGSKHYFKGHDSLTASPPLDFPLSMEDVKKGFHIGLYVVTLAHHNIGIHVARAQSTLLI